MNEYVKLIDGFPLICKLILALPFFDNIVYGIYRIAKGQFIIGILWIIFAGWVLWLIDIYTLLTVKKITFLV
jgi:hypothetical protein